MRKQVTRAATKLLLALLLLIVFPLQPTQAAASVQFHDLAAAVDFPERIVFTLEVQATQPIQRVELRYRPLLGAVTFVARPHITPAPALSVRYERDMRVNYLPPGIDLTYRWRVIFADGSWVDSPARTLRYLDDRYQWVQRVSGPVELYSAVTDAQYLEQALTITTRSIADFSQRFGVELERPVRVLLYPSPEALRSALPLQSEEWIGGLALPEYGLVLAGIAPGIGAEEELARILSHEVLHLVIARATDNPFTTPPAWLDEGLATAYQMADDPRLDAVLERARRSGKLPSLRALGSGFGTDPEAALLGYAASRSVMEYLVATYGEEGVARLLAAYREGVTDDEALEWSLGLSVDELDRSWKAWLAERAATQEGSRAAAAVVLGVAALAAVVALWRGSRGSWRDPHATMRSDGHS